MSLSVNSVFSNSTLFSSTLSTPSQYDGILKKAMNDAELFQFLEVLITKNKIPDEDHLGCSEHAFISIEQKFHAFIQKNEQNEAVCEALSEKIIQEGDLGLESVIYKSYVPAKLLHSILCRSRALVGLASVNCEKAYYPIQEYLYQKSKENPGDFLTHLEFLLSSPLYHQLDSATREYLLNILMFNLLMHMCDVTLTTKSFEHLKNILQFIIEKHEVKNSVIHSFMKLFDSLPYYFQKNFLFCVMHQLDVFDDGESKYDYELSNSFNTTLAQKRLDKLSAFFYETCEKEYNRLSAVEASSSLEKKLLLELGPEQAYSLIQFSQGSPSNHFYTVQSELGFLSECSQEVQELITEFILEKKSFELLAYFEIAAPFKALSTHAFQNPKPSSLDFVKETLDLIFERSLAELDLHTFEDLSKFHQYCLCHTALSEKSTKWHEKMAVDFLVYHFTEFDGCVDCDQIRSVCRAMQKNQYLFQTPTYQALEDIVSLSDLDLLKWIKCVLEFNQKKVQLQNELTYGQRPSEDAYQYSMELVKKLEKMIHAESNLSKLIAYTG